MIKLKTRAEIELMRESALIVSKTLGILAKEVKPGVTTLYLDKLAEEFIREQGAAPGFLGMYGFPNTLCIYIREPFSDTFADNPSLFKMFSFFLSYSGPAYSSYPT